jgi:hypothetical protein
VSTYGGRAVSSDWAWETLSVDREYPGDPNLFAPQHFLARVLPINAKGFSSTCNSTKAVLTRPGSAENFSSGGLALTRLLSAWTHVVEPNQIDIFAITVLRNLEKIDDTKAARFASQLWSDIPKTESA